MQQKTRVTSGRASGNAEGTCRSGATRAAGASKKPAVLYVSIKAIAESGEP